MSTDLNGGLGGAPEGETPPVTTRQPEPKPTGAEAGLSEQERLELQQLRNMAAALDPFADDISRFVKDEEYRKYVQSGRDIYDKMGETHRAPRSYSPEMQMLRDELMESITPFKEQFDAQKTAADNEYQSKKTQVFQDGKPIVEQYLQKHPEIRSTPRFAQMFAKNIDELQEEAIQTGRPFKEVWDTFMYAYGGETERKAPPRQMRAAAGEAGIPAAPREKNNNRRPDGTMRPMREVFMETFERVGKAS